MPQEFTTKWWTMALDNAGVRDALKWSIIAGLIATAIALVNVVAATLVFISIVPIYLLQRLSTDISSAGLF
jgi:ABC-type spermidine/putrescine transport system permease subunit II